MEYVVVGFFMVCTLLIFMGWCASQSRTLYARLISIGCSGRVAAWFVALTYLIPAVLIAWAMWG